MEQLDGTWDTRCMAAIGDALFMFETNGSLYRATTATGAWQQLEGTWASTTAATALGNRIYAVDAGTLCDIDPETGNWESVCGGWSTVQLVGHGSHLYAFEEGGSLYKITL